MTLPTCDWNGCHNTMSLHYYKHAICEEHWTAHCNNEVNLKNTFMIEETP